MFETRRWFGDNTFVEFVKSLYFQLSFFGLDWTNLDNREVPTNELRSVKNLRPVSVRGMSTTST